MTKIVSDEIVNELILKLVARCSHELDMTRMLCNTHTSSVHCVWPATPVPSIRLATFTVLPQMSYCGFLAPITPATTGPTFRPTRSMNEL